MKRLCVVLLGLLTPAFALFSQIQEKDDLKILFKGIVIDASSLSPVPESQILVNGSFAAVTDKEGTFSIQAERKDSVEVRMLGYKPAFFSISDTLAGREFLTGVYLKSDTLSIGEVVIIPRLANLKSEILRTPSGAQTEMENARYNLAVSAYQGRISQGKIGDPESNYEVLRQKHRIEAYEKGGIPSDKMLGLSPFMLIPAAYLLINGFPSNPVPLKTDLTKQEIDRIHRKYLETAGRE